MRDFLTRKCIEVVTSRELYEYAREEFFKCVEELKTSDFWMDTIDDKAHKMQMYHERYEESYRFAKQLANALDEIEIFNEIVEADLGEEK